MAEKAVCMLKLGHDKIVVKLQITMDEESGADNKLNKMTEGRLNRKTI